MSVIEMVKTIKTVHSNDIVLTKIGKFVYAYGKDAYIISYIFKYKIKTLKESNNIYVCAFPKEKLNKIMAILENKKINYLVLDRRNNYRVDEKSDNKNLNQYAEYCEKSIKYIKAKNQIDEIYNYLISEIEKEREEIQMKKQNLKNKKGITLIALVVTIVVLLILAGVSISMLTGENGIITQAQVAKENSRGAEIKEKVEMAANENKMVDYTTGTKKDKQDLIDELVADKKLTAKEVELLETEDVITIGEIVIDFSILGETETGKTIGDVYSEDLVGKAINYTSNTALPEETEWIILGEDKDGSIMLTTSKPIKNGFTLNHTAEAWLTYEEDIKEACSIYGATVQGKEVKARSITLEDVNRVTGFIEPEINTYTFGSTLDFDNKKVNYYHPDAESENFWSKEETTYENDEYYYYIDSSDNTVKYAYEGNSLSPETYTTSTLKNMDIILGEKSDYMYLLGSRSVGVSSSSAYFDVATVSVGRVDSDNISLCDSDSDNFDDYGVSFAVPVRPIINLPSNIQVEELNGEWSILD